MIKPKNVKELIKAIQVLIKDKKLRNKLSKNGRKLVLEKFTLDKIGLETFKMYKKVITDFSSNLPSVN